MFYLREKRMKSSTHEDFMLFCHQLYAGQEARCGRPVRGSRAVALDPAALGTAFASADSNMGRIATANVLALTALDAIRAQQPGNDPGSAKEGLLK